MDSNNLNNNILWVGGNVDYSDLNSVTISATTSAVLSSSSNWSLSIGDRGAFGDIGTTYDSYCKEYLGIWGKEGEDNMLESYDILKVYKKNREEMLEAKADKAREEIYNGLTKQKEFEELVNSFRASIEQLYTSQFAEGQTESNVPYTELEIIKSNSSFFAGYKVNEEYYSEALEKIDEDLNKDIEALDKELEPVKALLRICNDKEEIEEVLKRYEILDKNGKINLK